jgi:hypothetical protein
MGLANEVVIRDMVNGGVTTVDENELVLVCRVNPHGIDAINGVTVDEAAEDARDNGCAGIYSMTVGEWAASSLWQREPGFVFDPSSPNGDTWWLSRAVDEDE